MKENLFKKIKTAKIETYPFPHFVIYDFLPQHIYHEMHAQYPGDDVFESAKSSSKARKIIESSDPKFQQLILKKADKIRELFEITQTREYQNLFLQKYDKHLAQLGADLSASLLHSQMDITRATTGYQRSVHLDRTTHIISSMLYINSTDDYEGEGGDLCLHELKNNTNDIYDVFPEDKDVPIVKRLQTKGNMFVCWVGCHIGYHSVIPITKSNGYRKFIYIAINDKNDTVWNKINIKVLSDERRQKFINE